MSRVTTPLPYRFDRVHTPLASPDQFGEEHEKQFRELGFVAIENVFSAAEAKLARERIAALIRGDVPEYEGVSLEESAKGLELTEMERLKYVRRVWKFTPYDAQLKSMSENLVLMSILRRLVGSEVKLIQEMALLKQAQVGREKPWHQDMAYFKLEPIDMVIGTWTALDPALPDNGCMHVIPGSHRVGPLPHYHVRDCQLRDEDVDVEKDVMVPLQPGGVLFFSALLHHGTPPNNSPLPRWAIQYHYASIHCREIDEEHANHFHDGAGYAGCAGLPRNKNR